MTTPEQKLPAWPKYGDKGYTCHDPCGSLGDEVFDSEKFERAKTEFYKARLKVAMEALREVMEMEQDSGTTDTFDCAAGAISTIGEVPNE